MKYLASIAPPILADEGAAVLITVVVLAVVGAGLYFGWKAAKRKGLID